MTEDLQAAVREWQALLGPAAVAVGEAAQTGYGHDVSGIERTIPAALRITGADTLPAVMRIASRFKVPVYPISTGHNWGYGTALPAQSDCVIIDLSRLKRILHFDGELGVVTLEPGVTQGMLADFLDAGEHPYMVPVTGAGPTCSVLANALERGYGVTPLVDHFAAVTDLEAVLADGSLYRTALSEAAGEDLARLFKWGIGPYSAGLFTQSGFGIVTRMSIVLARRPECVKVCLFGLRSDDLLEEAVTRIRSIIVKLPGVVGAINLMNQHRVLAMTVPYPAARLGADGTIPAAVLADLGQRYQIQPWTGFATLYGTRRIVAAAQREIKAALGGAVSRLLFLNPSSAKGVSWIARWVPGPFGKRLGIATETVRKSLDLASGRPNEMAMPLAYWRSGSAPSAGPRNPSRDGCGLLWYAPLVPMRPAEVRAYVEMVRNVTLAHSLEPLITLTSLNERLFDSTVPLIFERGSASAVSSAHACYGELFDVGRSNGWFPYRLGINGMDRLLALQSDSKTFHKRLREGVDPHALIAPGRYMW